MTAPAPHRVVARNSHSDSVNAIHNDEGARANGYRSALVPGGTVFAYLCHPVLDAWGRAWVERGEMSMAWRRPTYVDDEVEVCAEPASADSSSLSLTARRAGESEELAVGTAALTTHAPDMSGPANDVATGPIHLSPGERLPVPLEFAARSVTITGDDAVAYLDEVGEPGALLRRERLLHPAHLQWLASHSLFEHITFDTSFQIAATARSQHLRAVPWDSTITVSCRVSDEWERRGHHWLATECILRAEDGSPCAMLRRTSIYRLRPSQVGSS